jgi:hypothetical protein
VTINDVLDAYFAFWPHEGILIVVSILQRVYEDEDSTDLIWILLDVGKQLHTCRLLIFIFFYLTAILPSSIKSRIFGPLFR